jgi:transaldolase
LKAMERRAADGKPLEGIHSVASFFVSRVDTMVDKELQARLSATSSPAEQARLKGLLGKAANANAKQAYQAFLRVFNGPRWEALKSKGANLQRPLWASTSTKNPAYSDTMYVSELIGRHTVNTMPEETMLAFADHGEVRGLTVEEDLQGVRQALKELGEVGIDMEDITGRRLVDEGVQKFADSYKVLLDELRKKRDAVVTR